MAKSRRKYSAEFKREAVQLTFDSGRTISEVAANLGINRGLLQRWKAEMKADGSDVFPGAGRSRASDEELLRLKSELTRVQQERDILKKAPAYFARERN